ncbi:Rieske (2Fe-2S) protein [Streptomyces odontomachi]|uniref:Rieske (2Fe-2S) protein n=1 Tax=Streptomyces odontomachi TaxID=2944940 RepID=UPI00210AA2FF|nr:Rieske (2Fe-2S) protein [Streptomyces sp. ODS25]
MTSSQKARSSPSRRTVVAAAGVAGLTATLAACGSDDSGGDTGSSGSTGKGGSSDRSAKKGPLASTSDIPEGGGKIFADEQVVVTQPTKGDFKAFSTSCTHRGCAVSSVSDGTINCPCHGSKFSIEDGSVKHAPATQPLPGREIKVSGGSISLA